jgi:hypothetical protein
MTFTYGVLESAGDSLCTRTYTIGGKIASPLNVLSL